jgi:hypothetical protein
VLILGITVIVFYSDTSPLAEVRCLAVVENGSCHQ